MGLKEALLRNLKSWFFPFWIFAFVFSLVILGIFMYARTVRDEHISGAFGLAPMVLLLIIFFTTLSIQAIKLAKKENDKAQKVR